MKYTYNFDLDVMHPYMIRSFEPFFQRDKDVLELGSHNGDFTKLLLHYFKYVTCVEMDEDCCAKAHDLFKEEVVILNSRIEDVMIPIKYGTVILTHVLEHVDDPVLILRKIKDEWLLHDGKLLLVCPNANAISRQIAVKMRLVQDNSAVTPSEEEHGHKRTYSLNTLENDVEEAGLRIVLRSGIFFKALANFQWDRILNTDILSPEYVEGCFRLGQQYPDMCSSIFLVCMI
jgi:2-polyprenyl-3-methyl-5-hydroxy-6-metoxy-1,4-benzoquinol methylase